MNKYCFNELKLKGKVVEKGMNLERLSEKMGIARSTLYRKMKNDGDTLTLKDIQSIMNFLELSNDEMISIFFDNQVA